MTCRITGTNSTSSTSPTYRLTCQLSSEDNISNDQMWRVINTAKSETLCLSYNRKQNKKIIYCTIRHKLTHTHTHKVTHHLMGPNRCFGQIIHSPIYGKASDLTDANRMKGLIHHLHSPCHHLIQYISSISVRLYYDTTLVK